MNKIDIKDINLCVDNNDFMKVLHTSDWHLGQTLYGFARTYEHKSMLEQIEDR